MNSARRRPSESSTRIRSTLCLRLIAVMAAVTSHAVSAQGPSNLPDSVSLPDAPSSVLAAGLPPAASSTPQISQQDAKQAQADASHPGSFKPESAMPCPRMNWSWNLKPEERRADGTCNENPLQMVVQTGGVAPLTPSGKAELAGRNVIDPFNLITITGYSGIYVAFNAHSPYGPGFKGFGRLVGYSFAEDVQGEFFGVYAIPSLAHEDPRYHRLPGRSIRVRLLHAVAHTVLSQHDDGSIMPNYATLLTYPISAELSNAYVPGISTTGSSTRNRILLGYATDPAGALIAEFLPDVAKHVHVRVVFVQQILNQIATRSGNQP